MIRQKHYRKVSITLIWIMIFQVVSPSIGYALTSGPSQPEVQSFEPVGTSQMVDLFSGDFNYNIPLLEVGGYPINVAYHAGIGMEQEASWVGLGWNLNPGALNRSMRGIPDDFSGEEIYKEVFQKKNKSVSFMLKPKAELLGIPALQGSVGIKTNNYKGMSIVLGANLGIDDVQKMGSFKLGANLGLNTESGVTLEPTLSTSLDVDNKNYKFFADMKIGAPINSRHGLTQLNYSLQQSGNYKKNPEYGKKDGAPKFLESAAAATNGSFTTYNTPTYPTRTEFDATSYSFSATMGLGVEFPVTLLQGEVTGSYSTHKIDGKKSFQSYGYLNHHLGDPRKDVTDFNREKDGPFFDGTNILPLTSLTNDVFSVTGQGMAGAFRSYRNQISYVTDPSTFTTSTSGSLSAEIGAPGSPITFKGGGGGTAHFQNSRSGIWSFGNAALGTFNNQALPENDIDEKLFEHSYIKQLGELTSDQGRFDNLGGDNAIAFNRNGHGLDGILSHANGEVEPVENKRAIRNQLTNYKTFSDVMTENQDRVINVYQGGLNADGRPIKTATKVTDYFNYLDEYGIEPTQIFEYDVLRPDGMRYKYGQPAYNLVKEELNFSKIPDYGGLETNKTGIITYNRGSDDTPGQNPNGTDGFVSQEKIPAYTYSHLLTEVLSSDYSDLTGDGPTDDDYGNWVKFNYKCVAGPLANNGNYKWRFPYAKNESFSEGIANFNEGLKSIKRDDKANFSYGEKELWYVQSIESRSHIAIFETSDRQDAAGVDNRNGRTQDVSDAPKNQKLDKIKYYAKNDLYQEKENAVPLKTVHFVYEAGSEYALCKKVPNHISFLDDQPYDVNNSGKLTLSGLYFTYGNSTKGQYSKYDFDYNVGDYDYNPKSQDRWGNFKAEPAITDYNPQKIFEDDPLSNRDFPYAEQDPMLADEYAGVWNLSTIHLPSGGKIEVEYEADDYAYVQDKRAGQMFKLEGFSKDIPSTLDHVNDRIISPPSGLGSLPTSPLSGLGILPTSFRNHMVIEIDNSITTEEMFFDAYLDGIDYLYFRALVNLKGNNHEFVPGYSKFVNHGIFKESGKTYGWIELKGVGFDKNTSGGIVNPIAKAGWQFARLHVPEVVFPGTNFEDDGAIERVIRSLAGVFTTEVPRLIKGFNRSLAKEGYAQSIVSKKSWIRLNNPNYYKKGGGCRVKRIAMLDQWTSLKTGTNQVDPLVDAQYGQQYFYEKTMKDRNGELMKISSGVASYEPMMGSDENSLKEPVFTNEARLLAPDNQYYLEKPIGESFFPAASVGYSQVVVADLRPANNSDKTATGFTVSEFYTAKDFPYETRKTRPDTNKDEPGVLSRLFKFRMQNFLTTSMGYSVIINDMHGKPKASWVYGGAFPQEEGSDELVLNLSVFENQSKISGQEYFYKFRDRDKKLDNKVKVIKPDGTLGHNETIGVETDIAIDFRENFSETVSVEVQANVDTWIIPLPFVPPLIFPNFPTKLTTASTRFRSAVVTKVVNHHGLLDKVRVYDQGASLQTQNMLYDAQTGEVLVTSVNNEYRDKVEDIDPLVSEDDLIYNMKYPAHWGYKGMRQAYQNIGVKANILSTPNGNIGVTGATSLFFPGDEVLARGIADLDLEWKPFPWVTKTTTGTYEVSEKFWVAEVTNSAIKLIDRTGALFTSSYQDLDMTVIPSSNFTVTGYQLRPEWQIKVTRSGYRNQQMNPIASLTSLKNPVDEIIEKNLTRGNSSSNRRTQATRLKVLNANAQTFKEEWQGYCGTETPITVVDTIYREICLDKTDVVFILGTRPFSLDFPIDAAQNQIIYNAMRSQIISTVQEMNQNLGDEFRYAVIYGNSDNLLLPFTNDVNDVYSIPNEAIQLDGLQSRFLDLMNWVDDNTLTPREDIPLNVMLYTNDTEKGIFGTDQGEPPIIDFCSNINNLKNNYKSIIGIIEYRSQSGNYPLGINWAMVASPGWAYNNFVSPQCEPDPIKPRRYTYVYPGETAPDFTVNLNCYQVQFTRTTTPPILCGVEEADVINPYVNGILGNWRPHETFVPNHTTRSQVNINQLHQDIASRGYYNYFDQFWATPTSNSAGLWVKDDRLYTKTNETTKYTPYGEAVESVDALNNSSAVLMGYDKKLPIAVGSNTKYQEIAFDGFEEYDFYTDQNVCHAPAHLDLGVTPLVTQNESHTGLYSLELPPQEVVISAVEIDCANATLTEPTVPYQLQKCRDCLTGFSPNFNVEPDAENRYVLDLWVKNYDPASGSIIRVGTTTPSGTNNNDFQPDGPVIEGWQRVYAFFSLEDNMESLNIHLENLGTENMFVDDLRIYPYDANMKSFVYHPSSLKLMAELDENNHATFYEYDEQWNLVRVKKETERGILTIQESRNNTRLIR